MVKSTRVRIIAAAADLLDAGGQDAVTLRAVAEIVSLSHNAPYRHFRDRNALLAAVAERDLDHIRQAFEVQVDVGPDGRTSLRGALRVLIAYARQHPARYRLLFSDSGLVSGSGVLDVAAFDTFKAFAAIVQRCQAEASLPAGETARIAGLIHATLHGAIDLELGGRAKEAKGLGSIEVTVDLLLDVLRRSVGKLKG